MANKLLSGQPCIASQPDMATQTGLAMASKPGPTMPSHRQKAWSGQPLHCNGQFQQCTTSYNHAQKVPAMASQPVPATASHCQPGPANHDQQALCSHGQPAMASQPVCSAIASQQGLFSHNQPARSSQVQSWSASHGQLARSVDPLLARKIQPCRVRHCQPARSVQQGPTMTMCPATTSYEMTCIYQAIYNHGEPRRCHTLSRHWQPWLTNHGLAMASKPGPTMPSHCQ